MSDGGFPVEAARAHIEYLTAVYGIEVFRVRRQWKSEADLKLRAIYISDPRTPLAYMIALHEIGHIMDKVAAKVLGGRDFHGPGSEAAAWSWAYDNADPLLLTWLTPRHWRRIGQAWVTHLGKRARSASPYG